jgi:hypothetical protein
VYTPEAMGSRPYPFAMHHGQVKPRQKKRVIILVCSMGQKKLLGLFLHNDERED